jgi:hypothetical protein
MKFRMANVFQELMLRGIDESAIFSSSPDEIVIVHTPENESVTRSLTDIQEVGRGLHLEVFLLEQAHPEKPFFIKRHMNQDKNELKGVPKFYVPEVIRHLKGESPQAMDRFFIHEGRLCQYAEPLYLLT